jgi:hypothetical protein
MEKKDKAEELIKSFQNFGPLEDVPADVSLRFQETLTSLAIRDSQVRPKKTWLSSSNQFALAASFTLVFALGAVFTVSSGDDSTDSVGVSQNQSDNTSTENNIKDDQLLYSAGGNSIPETSNSPIKLSSSAHDYVSIPTGFQRKLGVGNTWNSTNTLEPATAKCLESLGLNKSTNLIDSGLLKSKTVKAIWTPINSNSWNIYLVDDRCEVLEKKFFKD